MLMAAPMIDPALLAMFERSGHPVRVKKTRQNKDLERLNDPTGSDIAPGRELINAE